MVGERVARRARRCRPRAASRRISPDRRCRRRPAPGARAAPRRACGSGSRRPWNTGRPAPPPRSDRRAIGPSPITSSASARRELRVERRAQRTGRKHPAVADAARGRRPPASDRSLASDGFWKPSSITMTSAPAARAAARAGDAVARDDGRRERAPAAAARRRRRPRDAQRGSTRTGPASAAAIAAAEHERAARRPPASSCATAIAVGVLPAPPTVRLPMQITGTPACAPGSRHAPRRDRAVDRGERRQQAPATRLPGATRSAGSRIVRLAASRRNCIRYGSSAATVRSSAPPSVSIDLQRRLRRPSARASASFSQAPIRTVSLPASVTSSAPPAASSAA